jgi:hypothetical protein
VAAVTGVLGSRDSSSPSVTVMTVCAAKAAPTPSHTGPGLKRVASTSMTKKVLSGSSAGTISASAVSSMIGSTTRFRCPHTPRRRAPCRHERCVRDAYTHRSRAGAAEDQPAGRLHLGRECRAQAGLADAGDAGHDNGPNAPCSDGNRLVRGAKVIQLAFPADTVELSVSGTRASVPSWSPPHAETEM